jgi:hypothetical protein
VTVVVAVVTVMAGVAALAAKVTAMAHHIPALISSYLAGDNESTKNFLPPKTQPFN